MLLALGWPIFTCLKSQNLIYQPAHSKKKDSKLPWKLLSEAPYSTSPIAQSFVCCTYSQNLPHDGKEKFPGAAPAEGNNNSAMLFALTWAAVIAPVVDYILLPVTWYSKNDLQLIVGIVLNFRLFAPL